VLKIITDTNGIQLHTTQGVVNAKTVIVAVNAWTGDLLHDVGQFITPVRGQALAYTPVAPVFATGLSADITDTEEYWQQTPDGTIVLGGCRSVAPGRDMNVSESVPTREVQEALERVFPRLFPALHGLSIAYRWAGLMAFTPDYLPIVDRLPGFPGVWVCGGFSGHGMAYAIRLGQLLAESVTKGSYSTLLDPFSLSRPTLTS